MMSTTTKKTRQMDTKNHLKDTFLAMLSETPFSQIRIPSLCRQAHVARSLFYAYYVDIYDLLDEVLDDALIFLDSITDRSCNEAFDDLWNVVRQNDLAVFKSYNDRLPPCHRLIDIPKYHPLMKDETISALLIKKIFLVEKKHFIPYLGHTLGIPEVTAEHIFWFIINGSMAGNKKVGWCKNEQWHEMQLQVLRFIMYGLEGLQCTKEGACAETK